ncbi:MBL fold metallo-hydrolase [Bradyrhizobium sp. RDM4]|uniref:MBL fold metallo-hydrolase n=1 Tax=Bradyrhizobium sp. RDM4 TaxID=3378765 RepID=UPI0038FBED14
MLNVEHGSSIVVEYDSGTEKAFGVVDSNLPRGVTVPKALTKLRQLGARKLSFVCLTHPHVDHFKGLFEVIRAYEGSIDYFYSCPFGDLFHNEQRLKTFASKLRALHQTSEGEPRKAALELLQIIRWAKQACESRSLDWRECAGEHLQLAPTGFTNVSVATILPPNRAKGDYIQNIDRQDGLILGTFEENAVSLAFEFSYHGTVIVIGGDGTAENWRDRRRWEKNRGVAINAKGVNLPHHGSRTDCSDEVLAQLFSASGERAGVSSANGHSHPSIDAIKWMERNNVKPYCTNLIPQCGANARQLLNVPNLDPRLNRWLNDVATNSAKVQVCQGDVTITVDTAGLISIDREVQNLCAYRGEFAAYGLHPSTP